MCPGAAGRRTEVAHVGGCGAVSTAPSSRRWSKRVTKADAFNFPTLLLLDVCSDVTKAEPAKRSLKTTMEVLLGFVLMELRTASFRLFAHEPWNLDTVCTRLAPK